MSASNSSCRALPCALAWYIAVSASRIISSGLSYSGRLKAMPMLADVKTSRPAIENGALSDSWIRYAIALAWPPSPSPFSRTANSSPPSRASSSPSRRQVSSRRDTADQQLVAHQVAQAVVDHLEAIEVEIQRREGVSAPVLEVLQPAPQALDEDRAVQQTGQRVAEHRVADPLLGALTIGLVGHRPADARRTPVPDRAAMPRHRTWR